MHICIISCTHTHAFIHTYIHPSTHTRTEIPVWKEVTPEEPSIPELRLHTMVVLADHVWVYGGVDLAGAERSSLWGLLIPEDWDAMGEWIEYVTEDPEEGPGPRSMHCSVVVGERVFIWGGQQGCCFPSVCERVGERWISQRLGAVIA
jgi:hypothetical protein